jgi:hypothetical protein
VHRSIPSALVSIMLFGSSVLVTSAQELTGQGTKSGTKVVIRSLQRDEGGVTVTLRFQIVSEREKPEGIYQLIGGYLDDRAYLVDAVNKKKYLMVKDSSGKCECTQIRGNVAKDEPANLWAKYPAPPESVQKVNVVVDGFEPVDSVSITGR